MSPRPGRQAGTAVIILATLATLAAASPGARAVDTPARAHGSHRMSPPLGGALPAESFPATLPPDAGTRPPGTPAPFNLDRSGLPQNEESVASCPSRPDVVFGGVNDYRGLAVDPTGHTVGASGWQLSLDGGATVAKDGIVPGVSIGGAPVPSQGDPAVAAAPDCRLYYSGLDTPPDSDVPTAVSVFQTDPGRLAGCGGGLDPSCWTSHRVIASSTSVAAVIDKPWMVVGRSGRAGIVVWVAWVELQEVAPGNFASSTLWVSRCDAELVKCTRPMQLTRPGPFVQFADLTVGPDGRTYLTWVEYGTAPDGTQTLVTKLRIAPAGSTRFGPARNAFFEPAPIPDFGLLHADDFRVATYPKNTVALVHGRARVFVTWDACRAVVDAGFTCEEARIRLRYSDDDGRSWVDAPDLSVSGDNYFPTIDTDQSSGRLAVAYYTNRADPFHHRQQVELVTVDAATATVTRRQTLSPLNEPDADPHLQGSFIGDYFEVSASQGRALVHFNANYRLQKFVGTGVPVPQQDNYLVVAGL